VPEVWDGLFGAWRAQLLRSMRPLRVVVRGILGEQLAEMSLAEDQHAVGEFGSDGQDEAFGEAVRPRATRRDLDHLDTRIRQHRVKRPGELTGAIADQEPELGGAVTGVFPILLTPV
jgi:hypothetical protein